jgi:histone-lysine N-methyltransferase SETMAR
LVLPEYGLRICLATTSEKFPKENDTQFNQKIHADDHLESAWIPFDQGSRKGRKFNAGRYIAEILEQLSQWRSIEAADNERKLQVHADNARPHTAKLSTQYWNENRRELAPHRPYSPDLAPSDFYLSGYLKRCLGGFSFEDVYHLLAVIEGVREGIEKVTLQAVFLEWMDRLRKCITTNGKYTE